jgi:hypothetical protein
MWTSSPYAHQRLRGSYHDAAVSADEQRDMARLLYIRGDALTDAVPGNTRSRPVLNGRDMVMGQITGDSDIPFIKNLAAGSF